MLKEKQNKKAKDLEVETVDADQWYAEKIKNKENEKGRAADGDEEKKKMKRQRREDQIELATKQKAEYETFLQNEELLRNAMSPESMEKANEDFAQKNAQAFARAFQDLLSPLFNQSSSSSSSSSTRTTTDIICHLCQRPRPYDMNTCPFCRV